jgi:hypothetical protein
MRGSMLLLGASVLLPAGLGAQSRDHDVPRSRERREAVVEYRRYDDGPVLRFRYADEGYDAELLAFRRGTPRPACGSCRGVRCSDREWREVERCRDRVAELERKEAEWRRDARRREQEFERDMARREREFREKELRRWRDHQRKMAEHWRELERYR